MIALPSFITEPQPLSAHLWIADVGLLADAPVAHACDSLLNRDERKRNCRFRRMEDRRLDLLTRAVVRSTLSSFADVDPRDWRFETDANGRRRVAEPPTDGLHFSASHAGTLVACVVARGPAIGVDVERVDPGAIVPQALAIEEQGSLRPDSPDTFFSYWTLREAHAKAMGTGLADDTRTSWFELTGDHGATLYEHGGPATGWWFHRLIPGAGHVLAVAMQCDPGTAPVLTHHDWAAEFRSGAE